MEQKPDRLTEPLRALDEVGSGMAETLRANIRLLEERRRHDREEASLAEKLAQAITNFTGSMKFVLLHAVVYSLWVAVNLGLVPGAPRFDPSFVILATEASVEAIFLSTFVLISQNRISCENERRADLDLHINLLAEHEVTRLAQLMGRVAQRLGVAADDADFGEVKRDVEPGQVLDTLEALRETPSAD